MWYHLKSWIRAQSLCFNNCETPCTNKSKNCNCDQNGGGVVSDEGYLTDKTKLPVTAMWFGDAGDASESGWHSLGKLECSGFG